MNNLFLSRLVRLVWYSSSNFFYIHFPFSHFLIYMNDMCWYPFAWGTVLLHTHRCKSLSHPCCLKTWNQGRGGWRNGVNEQVTGIGDLWVIKTGCGLVCTSSANPLSDKTETSVHQLWTPTHYILSIPFIASSILLLHILLHNYLLHYIFQIMIFILRHYKMRH